MRKSNSISTTETLNKYCAAQQNDDDNQLSTTRERKREEEKNHQQQSGACVGVFVEKPEILVRCRTRAMLNVAEETCTNQGFANQEEIQWKSHNASMRQANGLHSHYFHFFCLCRLYLLHQHRRGRVYYGRKLCTHIDTSQPVLITYCIALS